MSMRKTLLVIIAILTVVSDANAELILTVNGLDVTELPEVNGTKDLIIAIAGENEAEAQDISVTADSGNLEILTEPNTSAEEPASVKYLFNFTDEVGTDTVKLTVGGELIYQLVLFSVPEENKTIVFGIDAEALAASQLQPEATVQETATIEAREIIYSESDMQGSGQSGSPISGSPVYGPSFCPDLHRDHIVNFIDFAIFAENWLQTGGGLDGDFDGSGTVNVVDLANICFYWLEEEPIVAESQDVNVTEDQAVGIPLRAYDCDGNEGFAYSIIEQPLYGFMALDVNRVIYAPDINYVGEDHFTFVAEKDGYQSNIANISITVLADTDDDGLSDYDEINGTYGYVTDPYDPNTDSDDMPDGWEIEAELNPTVNDASGNPDNDGLTNIEEYNVGTHPNIADTDGDGLKDGDEVNGTLSSYGPIWPYDNSYPEYSTPFVDQPYDVPLNPLDPDTDLDGVMDGDEIKWGLDPNNADTDGDGVNDSIETSYDGDAGSFYPWPLWNHLHGDLYNECDLNANDEDTDGDTMPDAWEAKYANDYMDPRNDGGMWPEVDDDPDNDNLTNIQEYNAGTNPKPPEGWDTDGDGRSDGDGLVDGDSYSVRPEDYPEGIFECRSGSHEYVFGEADCDTDPNNQDTDGDGMPDGWETWNWNLSYHDFFDPAYNKPGVPGDDFDGDGLLNLQESAHLVYAWLLDTDGDNAGDGYEVNTLQTNPKNDDTDGDGLKDGDESGHGTSPLEYDSDGDLLADGWEVKYGFDPTDSNVFSVDPNGNNVYLDCDWDGLDDFEEVIYGTNPNNNDTDGDGVKDGDEVNQCSDPNDEYDNTAPPANEICQLRLTVGDPSISNSERYKLIVGPVTHIARKFGEPQWGVYKFRTGRAYDVKIEHIDSTREEPDYDYTANIEKVDMPAGTAFGKDDPDEILKEHSDWNATTEFYAKGKMARIGLYRPTHTNSFRGKLRSGNTVFYYHQVFVSGKTEPLDFPGIPCQEVIRWTEDAPLIARIFGKEGSGNTWTWPKDNEWQHQNGVDVAIQDVLRLPLFLDKANSLQTLKVDGVETEPIYSIHFDKLDIRKTWKE